MIIQLDDPVALVGMRWLSPEEGGRRSGIPAVGVFAPTAVFELGGDSETEPGWPAKSTRVQSILIRRTGEEADGLDLAEIGFLAQQLAAPYLHVGARLIVLDGARTIATAVVQVVY